MHEENLTPKENPVPLEYRMTMFTRVNTVFMFFVGVVGALWQYGHPQLTMIMLVLMPALAFMHTLSHKSFNHSMRQSFQVMISCAALFWFIYRRRHETLDLALIESSTILGLSLLLGTASNYSLLSIISLILIGYGGILPSRPVYLPSVFLFVGAGILHLYQTRTARLAQSDPEFVNQYVGASAGPLSYLTVHFMIFLGLWGIFAAFLPSPAGHSVGVIPVSFNTAQRERFPDLWKDWISPKKTKIDPEGDQVVESKGERAHLQDKNSDTLINAMGGEESMDSRGSGNSGTMGKDLVFRVRSTAKLYWMANMYDIYDGDRWSTSTELKENYVHRYTPSQDTDVVRIMQEFSVEKPSANNLFAAYSPIYYRWRQDQLIQDSEVDPVVRGLSIYNFPEHGLVLSENKLVPRTPWNYSVLSAIPTAYENLVKDRKKHRFFNNRKKKSGAEYEVDMELVEYFSENQESRPWRKNIEERLTQRDFKYRFYEKQLAQRLPQPLDYPREIISPRVKNLVKKITLRKHTPMGKATALRDYLRKNYKYSLTPPTIPEDREAIDYFLYESKSGYCVHFAQALAVMAQEAGMNARVVVGYSPGDYNALAGYFEVYEYHAHAWTQIYIDHYGWMTFDGVAPGELNLRELPSFLGKLWNPFPEDWSSRPPEMSLDVDAGHEAKMQNSKVLRKNKSQIIPGDISEKARHLSPTGKAGLKEYLQATALKLKEKLGNMMHNLAEAGKAIMNTIIKRAKMAFSILLDNIKSMGTVQILLLFVFLMGAGCAWVYREDFQNEVQFWKRKHRCLQLYSQIHHDDAKQDPGKLVENCCTLTKELLALAGIRRSARVGLAEYAEQVSIIRPELSSDISGIFNRYILQAYSSHSCPDKDISETVKSISSVWEAVHAEAFRNGKHHLSSKETM